MTSPRSSSDSHRQSAAFSLFSEGAHRWLWSRGWTSLHPIQEKAAAPILGQETDVLLSAPTAGGKTEAAFLPICSKLETDSSSSVGCICVSPLKALINDQFERLESLGEMTDVQVHRWHGDVAQGKKTDFLENPSGVLLITPESLEAFFVRRGSQVRRFFGEIAYIVVDELHAFIGTERGRQLQSQLARLEFVASRRIPRIGLSATLGDRLLAAEFLRPGGGDTVVEVAAEEGGREVKIQLRGYRRSVARPTDLPETDKPRADDTDEDAAVDGSLHDVASHLFSVLRGTDNLIFANSRTRVEMLADILRRACERDGLPNEFFPHHGSLSKDFREHAESRLKDASRPGTVLATTTLEMGIDVGEVQSIAQVGVPPSVSSLRQRLGRSGRREGTASVLRTYIIEADVPDPNEVQDALRVSIVQATAMTELLIARWCEPPSPDALHVSTLVQQVLSVIAQYGGVRADDAFNALCRRGPFRRVDAAQFSRLLRALGARDMIAQSADGLLVLGVAGEKLVDHYDFYAAFNAAEEFSIHHAGRMIGRIPLTQGAQEGQHLIFAGRRWVVVAVDEQRRQIAVKPSVGGRPPLFDGGGVAVHDRVRKRMWEIYQSTDCPVYLDQTARELLEEGRKTFRELGLESTRVLTRGDHCHVYPWVGDHLLYTLELLMRANGLTVQNEGVSLVVRDVEREELRHGFRAWSEKPPPVGTDLAKLVKAKASEKYDGLVPLDLLDADFVRKRLDVRRIQGCLADLATAN